MRHQHHRHTRINRPLERHKLHRIEAITAQVQNGQNPMRILTGFAMTGKMLRRRQHVQRLRSPHELRHRRAAQCRIIAERTPKDDRVFAVGFQIGNRSQIHVDANRAQFPRHRRADAIRHLVACRRQQYRRGKNREPVCFGQPRHQPTLLIDSDQQWNAARIGDGLLVIVGENGHAFRSGDVRAKEGNCAGLPFAQELCPDFGHDLAVQRHHEHLRNLVFERHLAYKVVLSSSSRGK